MAVSRLVFLAITVVCAGLIAVALYMEHVMGLEPCPLCMLQRLAVIAVGLTALAAALVGPRNWGVRVSGGGIGLFSLAGMGVAWRQLWLQGLSPEEVPPCGPGYAYLRETFPLWDVIRMALEGSGDCAEVHWQFLGLSIAGWTFVFFVALLLAGVWLLIRGPQVDGR